MPNSISKVKLALSIIHQFIMAWYVQTTLSSLVINYMADCGTRDEKKAL